MASCSPVCYPDGGTVDDILVYRYNERKYMLVVNAANTEKDFHWLQDMLTGGVSLTDISAHYALLALQGPGSLTVLQALTDAPLSSLKYYHFLPPVEIAGITCTISRTGYTGEDGFEIFCDPEKAPLLWDALMTQGTPLPVGLGARDILRLKPLCPFTAMNSPRS